MPRILLVDDSPDILDALDLLLSLHGYDTVCAHSISEALRIATHQTIDLVIQDMNFTGDMTSGDEGKSLFYQLREQHRDLPVILITAWTQLETAVELVKAGAADYLPKPWDDAKLLELVDQYRPTAPATSELIYQSTVMAALVAQAEQAAQAEVSLMITGANGVGKENLADYMHSHSRRASGPFIKVNMGALPEELMEAELFGAEKGAFTGANQQRIGRFEAANGGTLFLDEIGNLPLAGQMKLLRVLQSGEFERVGSSQTLTSDVRVICATNADLPAMVARGEFREDLWFRLNVIELKIPPLSARSDDIVLLATHFLEPGFSLSDTAGDFLKQQNWPGNVRELQNAIARACVFAAGKQLQVADFSTSGVVLSEREQVLQALQEHSWVIKKAADALNITRQALYRRIEKYELVKDGES